MDDGARIEISRLEQGDGWRVDRELPAALPDQSGDGATNGIQS
jgi:hypothetical protein